ncbi:hypothetical protein G7007_08180 [Pseudomonas entomophila]|uniref:hypothetical protein n=1 Tax=Pseudomonas entomophila TaxID=312306 RepID=UPI0015E3E6B6|nr:hypothetical protein [Pseudomonas entomophila]MBA1192836.1 hypothetical protein [Pseudomonas entomophila]
MQEETWQTVIITVFVTIISTVIANQISKSQVVERLGQVTGTVITRVTKFFLRFGLSIFAIAWPIWVVIDFGSSEKPIERWEIIGVIYFCFIIYLNLRFLASEVMDALSRRK